MSRKNPKTKLSHYHRQKQRRHRRTVFSAILAVIAVSGLSLILTFVTVPILVNDPAFTEFIRNLGPFGPIVYVILEAFQSLIPIWSGQPFEVLGGALFGWWAVLLTWASSLLACAIAFKIVRKLGRPFVEKVVGKRALNEFNFLFEAHNSLPFFICSMIPFFPDDIITYGGGLTKFKMRKYLTIVAISYPLTAFLNTAIGVGIEGGDLILLLSVVGITLFIAFLFYTYKDAVLAFLRRISRGNG